jgi:hypothetical protein
LYGTVHSTTNKNQIKNKQTTRLEPYNLNFKQQKVVCLFKRTHLTRSSLPPAPLPFPSAHRVGDGRFVVGHGGLDHQIAFLTTDNKSTRITNLENQLNRAVAALEATNVEIDNLNLLLTQERNRNDNHRNERDQAVAERAEEELFAWSGDELNRSED